MHEWIKWWKGSRLGSRRAGRRERRPRVEAKGRSLLLETLEPRHLLTDLAAVGFSTRDNNLLVRYDVTGEPAVPFTISVCRSADGQTPASPLMTHRVETPADLTPGRHGVSIVASFTDVPEDYCLVAQLDANQEVTETDESNNTKAFSGGVFVAADGT